MKKAVLLLIYLVTGCASVPSLKDISAAVSVSACAGIKADTEDGIDWDVDICAKGEVLGYELPDLCAEAGG